MRSSLTLFLTVLLIAFAVTAEAVTAQPQTPQRGSKGRVLGTVIGAAAGFGLGLAAGLTWFDDAVNSDRKVWTTAIGFAGAGGVAGYVLGRAVDRRARQRALPRSPLGPAHIDVPRTRDWRDWPRDLPRTR